MPWLHLSIQVHLLSIYGAPVNRFYSLNHRVCRFFRAQPPHCQFIIVLSIKHAVMDHEPYIESQLAQQRDSNRFFGKSNSRSPINKSGWSRSFPFIIRASQAPCCHYIPGISTLTVGPETPSCWKPISLRPSFLIIVIAAPLVLLGLYNIS